MHLFYTKLMTGWFLALHLGTSSLWAQEPNKEARETPTGVKLGEARNDAIPGFEFSFPALGTQVNLTAYHRNEQLVATAFQAAQDRVQTLGQILTDYDPESETSQLRRTAVESPQTVSQDLWQTLAASNAWYERSQGAFDASLGPLTHLWRKYRRVGKVPDQRLIEAALANCGWSQLHLDPVGHTIQLDNDRVQLDFGGIGKGYIVDEVFELLQEHGLACCLVNISGNMRCGPAPPGREFWRIAIAPLEKEGLPLRRIGVSNAAIATSGDLWQFTMIDGVRRSHILDPKTGYGVLGPIAATVIAKNAIDADALATAACILDSGEAIDFAEKNHFQLLVAKKEPAGPPKRSTPLHPKPGNVLDNMQDDKPNREPVSVLTTKDFPQALMTQER